MSTLTQHFPRRQVSVGNTQSSEEEGSNDDTVVLAGEEENENESNNENEDDENEDNFDLDEAELLQFTQRFSQYDEAFSDKESEEGENAPPPIDFSQDLDAIDAGDDDSKGHESDGDDSRGRKRRKFNSEKDGGDDDDDDDNNINSNKQAQQLPKDTKDTYYLEVFEDGRTKLKLFKVGESFVKRIDVGDHKTIYTIRKLYVDKHNGKKKAQCQVYYLIHDTFLGNSKDFIDNYGKYVFHRESQNVALKDLKHRITEEPKAKVYMEPPPKDTKGVGWTVAYGFKDGCDKCPMSLDGPIAIDLYAGAGCMSQGLLNSGFRVIHNVEKDPVTAATLKANNGKHGAITFTQSVDSYLNEDFYMDLKADHIHSSSPCQGFSKVNTWGNEEEKRKNNLECFQWVDAILKKNRNTGSFENVTGMLQEKNLHYVRTMMTRLLVNDYQVRLGVVNSAHYGDAQSRERVLLFTSRKPWALPRLPVPTHGSGEKLKPIRTAENAIGDLENIKPREQDQPGYVQIPDPCNPGQTILVDHHRKHDQSFSEDERLKADQPAMTVRCKNAVGHYRLDRALTNFERARIQGFPDTYQFCGTSSQIQKQIGNAVPLALATAIGKSILESYSYTQEDLFTSSEDTADAILSIGNSRRVTISPGTIAPTLPRQH